MVAPLEKPMALEMRMDGPFILVSNAIIFPRGATILWVDG